MSRSADSLCISKGRLMYRFIWLIALASSLAPLTARGGTLEIFPSYYLPRQGKFNLVDYTDGLFDGQHNLYSTDSDELLKTATATHVTPFTLYYFSLEFDYGGAASFNWWDNIYERSISYKGEVISAASLTSGGLDGGANAIAFALGSSLDDLRFFFQFRLKGSTATAADSSLAEAAVAQGMWKDADKYFEIDAPYFSSTWIGANNWPLGHDTYYVENIPEPATLLMASLAGAGIVTRLRRR